MFVSVIFGIFSSLFMGGGVLRTGVFFLDRSSLDIFYLDKLLGRFRQKGVSTSYAPGGIIHLGDWGSSLFAASPFVCHPLFHRVIHSNIQPHTSNLSSKIHHLITHPISMSFNSSFVLPNKPSQPISHPTHLIFIQEHQSSLKRAPC